VGATITRLEQESAMRLLTPFARSQTYRTLLFLVMAVPVAAVTLGLFIAGWTSIAVLAITPLVIFLLVGFRGAVGLVARADAVMARNLLGVDVTPPFSSGGRWFWGKGKAVLADPSFWKQQAYLAIRMVGGFAVAVGIVSLIGGALQAITYPIWYRWSSADIGAWHADTFAASLVFLAGGIVALLVGVHLIGPLGRLSGWLVTGLLAPAAPREAATGPISRAARRKALAFDAGVSVAIVAIVTGIWASTTAGYFWPMWVMLPLALVLAIHGWVELVEEKPRLRQGPVVTRAFSIHAGVWVALVLFEIGIWAVTSRGYFWPMWTALGAAIVLGVHALVNRFGQGHRLAQRIGVLEQTRSAAVDDRDAELRRIERNLHDGAQARLVALGMNLGLAEQKLGSDPEGAQQLVTEARAGLGEALEELRALARGIHPPVLADRGLVPALATLADRSAVRVTVSSEIADRLPPPVETAAYFVVAEALANAAKHADATEVTVDVKRRGLTLELVVSDDGRGGADPRGSGLTGMRRRVEALDGTLSVSSPAGGPTVVRAELPCAS
jgi:signal transduction histidine kinase